MKKILTVFLAFLLFASMHGCKSIRVGGSGEVGGVRGGGGIDIPIPK